MNDPLDHNPEPTPSLERALRERWRAVRGQTERRTIAGLARAFGAPYAPITPTFSPSTISTA